MCLILWVSSWAILCLGYFLLSCFKESGGKKNPFSAFIFSLSFLLLQRLVVFSNKKVSESFQRDLCTHLLSSDKLPVLTIFLRWIFWWKDHWACAITAFGIYITYFPFKDALLFLPPLKSYTRTKKMAKVALIKAWFC